MCLVLFLPVQSLLTCFRSSLTYFTDLVSNNCSSDSKALLNFIAFSSSPTALHGAFLHWCEGMVTVPNWPLQMQYSITLWAYLSHCDTLTQSYCHTVKLSHCPTVMSHTMTLSHSHTVTFSRSQHHVYVLHVHCITSPLHHSGTFYFA